MAGDHLDDPLEFLYEELPPEEMAAAKDHLAECPECRAETREVKEIVKAYRDTERPAPPPGLAARTAAHALREAKRKDAVPAIASLPFDPPDLTEARFEREFAHLKNEVLNEVGRKRRRWFTHPAWMVAASVVIVCTVLIHLSPRLNRQYEQRTTYSASPQKEIARQEALPEPLPEARTPRELEQTAPDVAPALSEAEAIVEELDATAPEESPASEAVTVPEMPAVTAADEKSEDWSTAGAIPQQMQQPMTGRSQVTRRPLSEDAPPSVGAAAAPAASPPPERHRAPASVPPSPPEEMKATAGSLRPTGETADGMSPAPETKSDSPSVKPVPPSVPKAAGLRPPPPPASVHKDAIQTESAQADALSLPVPAAPAPREQSEAKRKAESALAKRQTEAAPPTPQSSFAPPASLSESHGYSGLSGVAAGSTPLQSAGDAAGGSFAETADKDREEALPVRQTREPVFAQPVPPPMPAAGAAKPSSSRAPRVELPPPVSAAASAPVPAPILPQQELGEDEAEASTPPPMFSLPQTSPYLEPWATAPEPVRDFGGYDDSVTPYASSAPSAPSTADVREDAADAEVLHFMDFDWSNPPEIVQRPTPVNRQERVLSLSNLAGMLIADGEFAEAWKTVEMIRAYDPAAAELVAKRIRDAEAAVTAARKDEAPAAAGFAPSSEASRESSPYIAPQPAPTGIMEMVEPPEDPPLTEVIVPDYLAPPGWTGPAAAPIPAEPAPVIVDEVAPLPAEPVAKPVAPPQPTPSPVPQKPRAVPSAPPAPPTTTKEQRKQIETESSESDGEDEADGKDEEEKEEDAAKKGWLRSAKRPSSSSLWESTVGRDVRPLPRREPRNPSGGKNGGRPFSTDPYVRDD